MSEVIRFRFLKGLALHISKDKPSNASFMPFIPSYSKSIVIKSLEDKGLYLGISSSQAKELSSGVYGDKIYLLTCIFGQTDFNNLFAVLCELEEKNNWKPYQEYLIGSSSAEFLAGFISYLVCEDEADLSKIQEELEFRLRMGVSYKMGHYIPIEGMPDPAMKECLLETLNWLETN